MTIVTASLVALLAAAPRVQAPRVQVDTSLFKSFVGSSKLVFVNGDSSGVVVPCIDGTDVVRETKVGGKTVAYLATLRPGEQAVIGIHAGQPRTVHVVFKHYSPDGRFLGATEPRRLDIPALPQTIQEVFTFTTSQLKPVGAGDRQ